MSRHSAQGDPSSVRTRELALPTFLSAGLCGGAVLIFAATASGYLPGLPDRGIGRLPLVAGPTTAATRLGEVDRSGVRQEPTMTLADERPDGGSGSGTRWVALPPTLEPGRGPAARGSVGSGIVRPVAPGRTGSAQQTPGGPDPIDEITDPDDPEPVDPVPAPEEPLPIPPDWSCHRPGTETSDPGPDRPLPPATEAGSGDTGATEAGSGDTGATGAAVGWTDAGDADVPAADAEDPDAATEAGDDAEDPDAATEAGDDAEVPSGDAEDTETDEGCDCSDDSGTGLEGQAGCDDAAEPGPDDVHRVSGDRSSTDPTADTDPSRTRDHGLRSRRPRDRAGDHQASTRGGSGGAGSQAGADRSAAGSAGEPRPEYSGGRGEDAAGATSGAGDPDVSLGADTPADGDVFLGADTPADGDVSLGDGGARTGGDDPAGEDAG